MEIWKPITGYEGLYEVSNTGYVRTVEGKTTTSARFPKRVWKQRVLKFKGIRHDGARTDYRVSLWKGKEHRDELVARLVAREFCEGYEPNLTVNHINGNHLDNRAENLEWCSISENVRKGFATGLYDSMMRNVRLVDMDGCYIDFKSMAEGSRYLGRNCQYLSGAIGRGQTIVTDRYGEKFRGYVA